MYVCMYVYVCVCVVCVCVCVCACACIHADRIFSQAYPSWKRNFKYFGSYLSLAMMLALVVIVTVGVMVYRIAIRVALLRHSASDDESSLVENAKSNGWLCFLF